MADFSNPGASVSDMAAGTPGISMGTTGSMRDTEYASDDLWGQHDPHFRERYPSRPYARADRGYEHYQPAYRYGHDAARQHSGRQWDEVEGDLERGWHSVHGTSRGAWDEMKHAARDAWDHTRGDRPHAR
jgi:hypothetical protein